MATELSGREWQRAVLACQLLDGVRLVELAVDVDVMMDRAERFDRQDPPRGGDFERNSAREQQQQKIDDRIKVACMLAEKILREARG